MKKLEEYVKSIPDFPEKGIIFRDVTSVLQDAEGLHLAIDQMQEKLEGVDFDVVLGGDSVGFGRFAVGSQQYFHVVQLFELLVVYGDEPFGFESFHLVAVVYDVAEAVESSGAVEFFFGFADSRDYTEAETRMFVYFYACHNLSPFYLCG